MTHIETFSSDAVTGARPTVEIVRNRDPMGLNLLRSDWFFIKERAVTKRSHFRA